MKVGIFRLHRPKAGLWQDTLALEAALRAKEHEVSFFTVARLGMNTNMGGRPVYPWAATQDAIIFIETFSPIYPYVQQRPCAFIPNLDWACHTRKGGPDPVRKWKQDLLSACLAPNRFQVWAKTPKTRETLQRADVPSLNIGWALPHLPIRPQAGLWEDPKEVRFYLNAGFGGWQGRRGVDVAVRAYHQLDPAKAELTIKSINPVKQIPRMEGIDLAGLHLVEESWPWDRCISELKWHDVALMPSRFEGLGLTMLEALYNGVPVIATDIAPLNEYVVHERNGLLFEGRPMDRMRLAEQAEPSVDALAKQMQRVVEDRALLHALSLRASDGCEAQVENFIENIDTNLRELVA